MNTVYIGWDPREEEAYEVARESIRRHTSSPIKIIPLKLRHLTHVLHRPIEHRDGQLWCPISRAPMSTEFAISRFCVPFMEETGWALFADCDIICWEDIQNLFDLADPQYAVMVVKHQEIRERRPPAMDELKAYYAEKTRLNTKMDGQIQTYYSRKNWSSVILWNCDHPSNKNLNIQKLNNWPGRDLHAFKWLRDEEIGELPIKWNWLVNVTEGLPNANGIWHYTLGGPWLKHWTPQPYDSAWRAEKWSQQRKEEAVA